MINTIDSEEHFDDESNVVQDSEDQEESQMNEESVKVNSEESAEEYEDEEKENKMPEMEGKKSYETNEDTGGDDHDAKSKPKKGEIEKCKMYQGQKKDVKKFKNLKKFNEDLKSSLQDAAKIKMDNKQSKSKPKSFLAKKKKQSSDKSEDFEKVDKQYSVKDDKKTLPISFNQEESDMPELKPDVVQQSSVDNSMMQGVSVNDFQQSMFNMMRQMMEKQAEHQKSMNDKMQEMSKKQDDMQQDFKMKEKEREKKLKDRKIAKQKKQMELASKITLRQPNALEMASVTQKEMNRNMISQQEKEKNNRSMLNSKPMAMQARAKVRQITSKFSNNDVTKFDDKPSLFQRNVGSEEDIREAKESYNERNRFVRENEMVKRSDTMLQKDDDNHVDKKMQEIDEKLMLLQDEKLRLEEKQRQKKERKVAKTSKRKNKNRGVFFSNRHYSGV
ncbi:MAG: hypothetical protein AAFO15_00515 [Pseudomonadota bacterium]